MTSAQLCHAYKPLNMYARVHSHLYFRSSAEALWHFTNSSETICICQAAL